MSAPATKQDAAQRHFDRHAQRYSSSRLLRSLQGRALDELDLGPDDALLDVGCGAGKLVLECAPSVRRAAGLDLSESMLAQGREEAARAGLVAEFAHGSAGALPFGDAEFTAVVTTTASHHFPDPRRAIAEMARVLAPGGRLVVGDLCGDTPPMALVDALERRFEEGHVRFPRRGELRENMEAAGLRVRSARFVWAGVWVLVAADKP